VKKEKGRKKKNNLGAAANPKRGPARRLEETNQEASKNKKKSTPQTHWNHPTKKETQVETLGKNLRRVTPA